MPNNFLITGYPGSGKTTVIRRVTTKLDGYNYSVSGLYSPEIKNTEDERVGFELVDLSSGDSRCLAHIEEDKDPAIGKYGVNVENIDRMTDKALNGEIESSDFVVIDEIAPMEVFSDVFREEVREALETEKPVIASIHKERKNGFIGKVKERNDAELIEVERDNRDELPGELLDWILSLLE